MTVAERPAAPPVEPSAFEREVDATRSWMAGDRFAEIIRLYSPRNVVEQRGTIVTDYTVARNAADRLYARLRELFAGGRPSPPSGRTRPGQAVAMKRAGIEAIYLGGWATSAKGSATEDPGPDLASYPLSQVPDEAAGLVRALLTADRNQRFARSRMSEARARGDARGRLPPLHHRRRRHRPRRRRPRAQPHPPLRRGRRARATTSRTRSPAPRSAGTRAARCSSPRTSRSSASTPPASSSTSWACRGSSSPAPTPRRPTSSTGAATSATSRSSWASPTSTCRRTRSATWRSCSASTSRRRGPQRAPLYAISDGEYADADAWLERRGVWPRSSTRRPRARPGRGGVARGALDASSRRFLEAWEARRRPEDLRPGGRRRDGVPRRARASSSR